MNPSEKGEGAGRSPTRTLRLPSALLEALYREVEAALPAECVGFLYGQANTVSRYVPLRNIAATPHTRFFAEPAAMLRAHLGADALGETLLAVYHSHPRGEARLSEHDRASAQPGLVQLVLTPKVARAFVLVGTEVEDVWLELCDDG
jgi:proteasome lid subunit RPN8/RPN11